MHRCVVMGCRNLRENASSSGLTFFAFPEDHRTLVWCTTLNLDAGASYKGKVICSKHFLAEDMKITRKLLPTATPKILQIKPMSDLTDTSMSGKKFISRSTQSDTEPPISAS
ncbi:THAP domain-containing protein 5 [Folsomia candida]|uniref:THAP domain-containing protein 5 n=1 Tax=Folsomia candida TaxID=158441 RepID=A0A226EB76_FOLCA|nr:THAP domain-containing protein 5 [Folsomia candida]